MQIEWKRLKEKKLKNVGGAQKGDIFRVYGQNGKYWPRIVIRIFLHSNESFSIECSLKKSPKHWWWPISIPKELCSDIIEMLNKFNSRKGNE